jgi:hypothetical protein
MPQTTDPTFYRTPADAIAAPPERLAYVAAYDPAGKAKDAMAVLDVDPASPDYGRVVGSPVTGWRPSNMAWNPATDASPSSPRLLAPAPYHRPGDSPWPDRYCSWSVASSRV